MDVLGAWRTVGERQLRLIGLFAVCATTALSLTACGLYDKDDGDGSIEFTLETSDSPDKPNIAVPEGTSRFLLELIDESSDNSQAEDDSGEPEDEDERTSFRVGHFEPYGSGDRGNGSSDNDGGDRADVETTCSTIPASYSLSKDYNKGDDITLRLDNIRNGPWIVRVSALDENDKVLAHSQKAVTLIDGEEVNVSGWLQSGPAPEGYLFLSNTSSSSLVRLSLFSEELQTLRTPGHYPALLFCKGGWEAGVGSVLYAITGAADWLDIKVGISDTDCEVTEEYIPKNNGYVAPGQERAVVSYYADGGVRFYDYDKHSYSDLLKTDNGASEFSNIVNDCVWVSNERGRTMSKIDIANQKKIGSNKSIGYAVKKLRQNSSGTRIWSLCWEPSACVYVSDDNGSLVDKYTTQIVKPSDICLVEDLVCVADSGRGEIVFFDEASKCREKERLIIDEGVGEKMISDGQRLYVLTEKGSLAVVDLTTLSYNKTIKTSGDGSSIVWMH